MKILMFCRLYSPHLGGVEKHVKKISEVLLQKGHQITIITEKFKDDLPEEEIIAGIKVYRIDLTKKLKWFDKFRIWIWLFRERKLIKGANIVHCHDIFFWYLPFRFLFPMKPVFITFHGWGGVFPIPRRYLLVSKISEKLAFGNICVGDYLQKWYGTKPNFVTYGGVEMEPERTRPIAPRKDKIVFLGRLEKDNALLPFLKTFQIIKRKIPSFLMEFVGDGSLAFKARRWGRVYGYVANVYDKISDARYIFAASYLSIHEAMSRKKAVVALWDNPLKKDCLELSPFQRLIIVSSDPGEASAKVLDLYSDPAKEAAQIEKAYLWVKKQTWEMVTELYLKLWDFSASRKRQLI